VDNTSDQVAMGDMHAKLSEMREGYADRAGASAHLSESTEGGKSNSTTLRRLGGLLSKVMGAELPWPPMGPHAPKRGSVIEVLPTSLNLGYPQSSL